MASSSSESRHGLDGLMDGALGEAAHPKQAFLQFVQIVFEMAFHRCSLRATAVWPNRKSLTSFAEKQRKRKVRYKRNLQPKRPVMYASVRGSDGRGEQLRRRAELDQLAVQQEGGEIADARGLLHVVGDDDDGAEIFNWNKKLFDFCGADGIESGARLVEQQHFGFDGQRRARCTDAAAGRRKVRTPILCS